MGQGPSGAAWNSNRSSLRASTRQDTSSNNTRASALETSGKRNTRAFLRRFTRLSRQKTNDSTYEEIQVNDNSKHDRTGHSKNNHKKAAAKVGSPYAKDGPWPLVNQKSSMVSENTAPSRSPKEKRHEMPEVVRKKTAHVLATDQEVLEIDPELVGLGGRMPQKERKEEFRLSLKASVEHEKLGAKIDLSSRTLLNPDGTFDIIDVAQRGKSVDLFFTKYELMPDVIGRGSYSEVRLAKPKIVGSSASMTLLTDDEGRNVTNSINNVDEEDIVAVKIMEKAKFDLSDIEDIRREVGIMRRLRHDNIVKFYDFYEDSRFIYVVMEYLSGGELFTSVQELLDYTEKDTRDVIFTLVRALKYCHERGIAHRDLKPENILLRRKASKDMSFNRSGATAALDKVRKNYHQEKLTSATKAKHAGVQQKIKELNLDKDEFSGLSYSRNAVVEKSYKDARKKYDVVLVDFGFATQVRNDEIEKMKVLETNCGSPLYMAPEVLDNQRYNYKCDIWSLGVICYMLLSGGYLPYDAKTEDELIDKVMNSQWEFQPNHVWANVSDNAKDFLKRILMHDAAMRLNYDEIVGHAWFNEKVSISVGLGPEAQLTLSIPSVDFSPMKRFNVKRKLRKADKLRKAAVRFKLMMEEIEETVLQEEEHAGTQHERDEIVHENKNFMKYATAVKLSSFYTNPNLMTEAELGYFRLRTMKHFGIDNVQQPPAKKSIPNYSEQELQQVKKTSMQLRVMLTLGDDLSVSQYLSDVDEHI